MLQRMLNLDAPNAVWDHDEQRLISDAEIAEIDYTAFTSRRQADHIQGRLIVRRVTPAQPQAQSRHRHRHC